MKKSILIICSVIIFSVSAFAYMSWEDRRPVQEISCSKTVIFDSNYSDLFTPIKLDLVYKVEPRFMTRVTKERLNNATTIIDILPKEATKRMETYQNVVVSILQDNGEVKEIGVNETLNEAQLELLQSADYSTNFYINADCQQRTEVGKLQRYALVYYMTIIPEQEAIFAGGNKALVDYLKENSKAETAIITEEKLRPGKVHFIVTKEGKITNVKLESTSGFSSVDEKLIELITDMPQNWQPATDSKGEKVDQELVFFFGLEGC